VHITPLTNANVQAIDKGYIDVCHGVVREGKEGIVLYAEGGGGERRGGSMEEDGLGGPFLPNYTPAHCCVKVYKRIVAFKNRGDYVDGDVRYYKKRFSDVDKRDQLTLWAEKEFRNMTRAFVGGVCCPRPVMTKENVCMMTFLGNDGFPAPTLKEVGDLGFVGINEKKLKRFLAETVVGIR
jgi:serine/threonine-protein kinase RIO1